MRRCGRTGHKGKIELAETKVIQEKSAAREKGEKIKANQGQPPNNDSLGAGASKVRLRRVRGREGASLGIVKSDGIGCHECSDPAPVLQIAPEIRALT